MTPSSEILDRERSFHENRLAGGDEGTMETAKFYSIAGSAWRAYEDFIADRCAGKRLLELGCGTGAGPLLWLKRGAIVTCIDIAPECVRAAERSMAEEGYHAAFHVMNAEETGFGEGEFDLVVGAGILHHLRLERAYPEIARILTDEGAACFFEPLGHNPFINAYRRRTPLLRTADEHPLTMADLRLARRFFGSVEVHHFGLCALLCVPFRKRKFFPRLLALLEGVDACILRIPFLKKYSWIALLRFARPVRDVSSLRSST